MMLVVDAARLNSHGFALALHCRYRRQLSVMCASISSASLCPLMLTFFICLSLLLYQSFL